MATAQWASCSITACLSRSSALSCLQCSTCSYSFRPIRSRLLLVSMKRVKRRRPASTRRMLRRTSSAGLVHSRRRSFPVASSGFAMLFSASLLPCQFRPSVFPDLRPENAEAKAFLRLFLRSSWAGRASSPACSCSFCCCLTFSISWSLSRRNYHATSSSQRSLASRRAESSAFGDRLVLPERSYVLRPAEGEDRRGVLAQRLVHELIMPLFHLPLGHSIRFLLEFLHARRHPTVCLHLCDVRL